LVGIVRSITATLTSSPARPIIDVTPVLAFTNEMGTFETALDSLCDAYRGLFQLVTYDAGACSADNAAVVRARDLHYLFGLTAAQPTLFEEAKRWLGSRRAADADVRSSTPPLLKTTIPGSRATPVRRSWFRSCVASLTRCSRSFAASRSAHATAARPRGRR